MNLRQEIEIRPDRQSYLILNNIAKDANFGWLIRTANAFGAVPVIVGRRRYSKGGAAAQTSRTPVLHFHTLPQAVEDLRKRGCEICGVEIMPDAESVTDKSFDRSTAFMIGNEGEGLIETQKQHCDSFVYIPQFGNAVSLNINVATGIVLHRYATAANFIETERSGEKFLSR